MLQGASYHFCLVSKKLNFIELLANKTKHYIFKISVFGCRLLVPHNGGQVVIGLTRKAFIKFVGYIGFLHGLNISISQNSYVKRLKLSSWALGRWLAYWLRAAMKGICAYIKYSYESKDTILCPISRHSKKALSLRQKVRPHQTMSVLILNFQASRTVKINTFAAAQLHLSHFSTLYSSSQTDSKQP